jgi:hypothetical protein
MSELPIQQGGLRVLSSIVPSSSASTYGTHYSYLGVGGYVEVPNIEYRNSIPSDSNMNDEGYSTGRRRYGMLVYVIDDDKLFRLFPYSGSGVVSLETFTATTELAQVTMLSNNNGWVEVPDLSVLITGGTYFSGSSSIVLYDSTGGTVSITGITTTDVVNPGDGRVLVSTGNSESIFVAQPNMVFNGTNLNITGGTFITDSGGSLHSSAIIQFKSTTKGVLLPGMTTSQKNAIVNPTTGLTVYDSTIEDISVYTSSGWTGVIAERDNLQKVTERGNTTNTGLIISGTTYIIGSGSTTGNTFVTSNSANTQTFTIKDSGNVLIGTTTDAGYKLDVNGTARVQGLLTISTGGINMVGQSIVGSSNGQSKIAFGLVTSDDISLFASTGGPGRDINIMAGGGSGNVYIGTNSGGVGQTVYYTFNSTNATFNKQFIVNGSITAASALAQGVYFNNTLVAAANNDVLVGLDINPTFTNGAFTGVQNLAVRIASTTSIVRIDSSVVGSFHGIEFGNLGNIDTEIKQRPSTGEFRISNGRFAGWGGFITLYTDTAERMRIRNNGNVLIGTTTDAGYKLDVNGSTRIVGSGSTTGNTFVTSNSANTQTFTIKDSGNVLIGTTTDGGEKLYVNGNTSVNGNLQILNNGGLTFYNGASIFSSHYITTSNELLTANSNNSHGAWKFNNYYVSISKNLAVGTTLTDFVAPSQTFLVLGSSVFSGSVISSGVTRLSGQTSIIGSGTTSGSTAFSVQNSTGGTLLNLFNNGNLNIDNDALYVDGDNRRVGIGTTTPENLSNTTTLTINGTIGGGAVSFQVGGVRTGLVNGNDNYLTLQSYASRALSIGYNGNNTIVVNTSNNVGIGTVSPTTKLDVNGTARIVGAGSTSGSTILTLQNSLSTTTAQFRSDGVFGISSASTFTTQVTSVISASTTNSGIAIVPNGTGAFTLSIPDGTDTGGGNARGQYAVDLKLGGRTAATQVASGNYSAVIGGDVSTASGVKSLAGGSAFATGTNSVALGGSSTASGSGSVAIGGEQGGGLGATASGRAAIAFGLANTATADFSNSLGGLSNSASGSYSSVVGGQSNTSSASNSSILGGWLNINTGGSYGSIGGGRSNVLSTSSWYTFIGGGWNNGIINGDYSVVVGGFSNSATTQYAAVIGGSTNRSSGLFSLTHGLGNTASSSGSTAIGYYNTASGGYSIAMGSGSTASGLYSTVSGGYNNRATGVGVFIGGGVGNSAGGLDNYQTIVGGNSNTINAAGGSFIGGGQSNTISNGSGSGYCIIVGGSGNLSNGGIYNTIGGGLSNTASASYATVVGGQSNTASGQSSISGGNSNTASGAASVAFGTNSNISSGAASLTVGYGNQASGSWSVALGIYNQASATGAVALGGSGTGSAGTGGNTASGIGSFAVGQGSSSYLYGQNATAAYYFSTRGDAQQSLLTSRAVSATTSGSTITLSLDGTGTTNLITPNGNNRAWNVVVNTITVCTVVSGGTLTVGDAHSGEYKFLFKRVGGTSTISPITTSSEVADTSMGTASYTFSAGTSQQLAIVFNAPTTANNSTFRAVAKVALTEVAW